VDAGIYVFDKPFIYTFNCEHCTPYISMIYLQIDRCLQMYFCIWQWQPNEDDVFFLASLMLLPFLSSCNWFNGPQKRRDWKWDFEVLEWLTDCWPLRSILHLVCIVFAPRLIRLNLFVFDTLFHSLCLSAATRFVLIWLGCCCFHVVFYGHKKGDMARNCRLACWAHWNGGQVVVASCVTCRQMEMVMNIAWAIHWGWQHMGFDN